MEAYDDTLVRLARRMQLGDANAKQPLRQELEERLVPLVRCALRSGVGVPALVKWVRGRVAELTADGCEPLDPRQAAPRIARLLCAGLIRELPVHREQETVLGR